jgi:methionyl-tRNA synthetase
MDFITTPIYYVNAEPHLGHFYCTLVADVLHRYAKQRGDRTYFLTGVDEHGEKIAQMAAQAGKSEQTFTDEVAALFKETWDKLDLKYDRFYRTTDAHHKAEVQKALQFLKDKNEIEFREYEGNYCVGCERFLTDQDLNDKGQCKDHLKVPEHRKESNYFFLMSKYQDRVVAHYKSNPGAIKPEGFRNEVLSFLEQPLEDLCISRPKTRLTWGIELPFDNKYVTYVWFDALLNYLVATGWSAKEFSADAREQWSGARHLIGKDILKTHAIYWPTMLMALEVPVFRELNVSGYWMAEGQKMSKSLGNVLRPLDLSEKYGREALRFYLLKEMSYGFDASFGHESMVNSANASLANGIGNLTSRVLTLATKNFAGGLKLDPGKLTPEDRALLDKRAPAVEAWQAAFADSKYHLAMKVWSELVTACDLYINEMKPWALAKDPAQKDRLEVVLATAAKMLQALSVLSYPVLPEAALKLLDAIGVKFGGEVPSLAVATQEVWEFQLAAEVPRLFPRLQMVETTAPVKA